MNIKLLQVPLKNIFNLKISNALQFLNLRAKICKKNRKKS